MEGKLGPGVQIYAAKAFPFFTADEPVFKVEKADAASENMLRYLRAKSHF